MLRTRNYGGHLFDEDDSGPYRRHKAEIRIKVDGEVSVRVRPGTNVDYAPNDEERDAIKAVAESLPKSIPASVWAYENRLLNSGLIVGQPFPVYDLARENILTVEERIERDGGKICVLWTLFDVPGQGPRWYMAHPDGSLPFWKPWRHKKYGELVSRHLAGVMVHEGVKAAAFVDGLVNDPERREERDRHPLIAELSDYEHWGTIGGAGATHFMDFEELRRRNVTRVVYICDHDSEGEEAVRAFSRGYGKRTEMVMFDGRFPVGFDLADKIPVKFRLQDLYQPATWATLIVDRHKNGRPICVLTKDFKNEWRHTIEPKPGLFINERWPKRLMFAADQFDHYVAPFSDIAKVSELIKKEVKTRLDTVSYRPDLKPDKYNADNHYERKSFVNIYQAPHILDYASGEAPDISPIVEYFNRVYPVERDRIEVMRWTATLILCVQPVSATPLVVYRLAFGSPRSFAGVD
jgi:hypothetical protein